MHKINYVVLLFIILISCKSNNVVVVNKTNNEIDKIQILKKLNNWIDLWKIKNNENIDNIDFNNNQDFNFIYILNENEVSKSFSVYSFVKYLSTNENLKKVWNEFFHNNLYLRNINITNSKAQISCDLVFSKPETISDTFITKLEADLIKENNFWIIKSIKFLPNNKFKPVKIGGISFNKIFYRSTVGIPLRLDGKEIKQNKQYIYFKIENLNDLSGFYFYLDTIVGDGFPEKNMLKGMLYNTINYSTENVIIILTPKTTDLFIDQSYYIDDDNSLIFEITKNGPTNGYSNINMNVEYYYSVYFRYSKNKSPQITIKEFDKEFKLAN